MIHHLTITSFASVAKNGIIFIYRIVREKYATKFSTAFTVIQLVLFNLVSAI